MVAKLEGTQRRDEEDVAQIECSVTLQTLEQRL